MEIFLLIIHLHALPFILLHIYSFIYTYLPPDINECASNPCKNEGVCSDGIGGFSCECAAGYEGDKCEISTYMLQAMCEISHYM